MNPAPRKPSSSRGSGGGRPSSRARPGPRAGQPSSGKASPPGQRAARPGGRARPAPVPQEETAPPPRAGAPGGSRRGRSGRKKKGFEERLQKYIANCGYCSRRRAELLIEQGLVQVNGQVVRELGTQVDPSYDTVTIHGEKIRPPERLTILLNKPAGYLTSTEDTHERLTVMDLLPKKIVEAGVLPAGRLDFETEGMLVLTNDGDLQHRITHPRFGCLKEYRVHISRPLRDNDQRRLERGVNIRELGKRTSPATISQHRKEPDGTATCHITIGEGMKRQVRRMFKVVGIDVLHLERIAIGDLQLGPIGRGQWRTLQPDDIAALTRPTPPASAGGRRPRRAAKR